MNLADLDIGSAFEGALRLAFRNWGGYLRTQGLFVAASWLLVMGALWWLLASVATLLDAPDGPSLDALAALLGEVGGVLVVLVLVMWLLGAVGTFFGIALSDALLQAEAASAAHGVPGAPGAPGFPVPEPHRPGLGRLWTSFGTRLAPFLGASILAGALPLAVVLAPLGLILVGAFADGAAPAYSALGLLLMVPAFFLAAYLFLRWYVAPAAAVFEPRGASASLGASAEGTRGAKLHLLVLLLLLGIVGGVASTVLTSAASVAAPLPDPDVAAVEEGGSTTTAGGVLAAFLPGMLVQMAASMAVSLFFAPVGSAAMVLVYRQLRRSTPAPAWPGQAGPFAPPPTVHGAPPPAHGPAPPPPASPSFPSPAMPPPAAPWPDAAGVPGAARAALPRGPAEPAGSGAFTRMVRCGRCGEAGVRSDRYCARCGAAMSG